MNPPSKQPHMFYLYLLSFVGIIITVVASIGMVNLVLKRYVFQVSPYSYYSYYIDTCNSEKLTSDGETATEPTKEEKDQCIAEQKQRAAEEEQNQMKRELSGQIAGFIIGLPLWLYHWGIIRRRRKEEENK